MRFLALAVALLAFCQYGYSLPKNSRVLEVEMTEAIECVRAKLIEGVEEFGLPSFNPLVLDSLEVNLEDLVEGATGTVAVQNLLATGITDFTIESISGSITLIPLAYHIDVTLNWETLTLESSYNLDITTSDGTAVWGNGDVQLEAVNLKADVQVSFGVVNMDILAFNLLVSVERAESFSITGVHDDPELSASITESILDDAAGFLAQYQELINTVVSDAILNMGGDDTGEGEPTILTYLVEQCLPF